MNKLTNIPDEVKTLSPEVAYLQGKADGIAYCRSILNHGKSDEEIKAEQYFSIAGIDTGDWSPEEMITKHEEALRREMNEGDIDINLSNEQVT